MTLPLRYNDGREIEPSVFSQIRDELIRRFGGLDTRPSRGWWEHEGIRYEEDNIVYIIDTSSDEDEFFAQYKKILRQRLDQKEIHLVKTPSLLL